MGDVGTVWFGGILLLVALTPAVFVVLGWRAVRSMRWEDAEDLSTLARVASWILLGLDGLWLMAALIHPPATWWDPAMGFMAYPVVLWVAARALARAIHRRRDAARSTWRAERKADHPKEPQSSCGEVPPSE